MSHKTALPPRKPTYLLQFVTQVGFCFVIMRLWFWICFPPELATPLVVALFLLLYLSSMSNKGMYRSVNKGIPALVCIPTGETVIINGKTCKLLKLMYDLNGEYMPLAQFQIK